jgi:hypothetical protein
MNSLQHTHHVSLERLEEDNVPLSSLVDKQLASAIYHGSAFLFKAACEIQQKIHLVLGITAKNSIYISQVHTHYISVIYMIRLFQPDVFAAYYIKLFGIPVPVICVNHAKARLCAKNKILHL